MSKTVKSNGYRHGLTRRGLMASASLAAMSLAMPSVLRAQGQPVRIGVLHPVTGPLAYEGEQCRRGALLAIEEINAARVGMLSPDIVEQDTAHIEVRELFRVPKAGVIAGCYVQSGEISRDDQVRIVRDGTVIFEGKMASLRRFKEDVKSVKQGYECGIGIENFQDLKEGDVIEGFRTVEVAREA